MANDVEVETERLLNNVKREVFSQYLKPIKHYAQGLTRCVQRITIMFDTIGQTDYGGGCYKKIYL